MELAPKILLHPFLIFLSPFVSVGPWPWVIVSVSVCWEWGSGVTLFVSVGLHVNVSVTVYKGEGKWCYFVSFSVTVILFTKGGVG